MSAAVISDDEHRQRVERIQAERAERGLPPTIQSESVYRLLAAVIDSSAAKNRTTHKND